MKTPLWAPSRERVENANFTRFTDYVNRRYNLRLASYPELHRWSVTDNASFWAAMWDFCGVKASKPYDSIFTMGTHMMDTKWFPGAKLNFAENLLRYRDEKTAIVFRSENDIRKTITYAGLYRLVARLAKSMRETGVKPGDRVAGFLPNMIETVAAMLATTSIGALWTSCSPDFGIKGALDRFGQIEPKVFFTADGYFYAGTTFNSLEKAAAIVKVVPSIEKTIVIPYTKERPDTAVIPGSILFDDFLSKELDPELVFEQLPSDHPLDIMYSSGTTGLPKCMVQGAAGVLMGHMRDLTLHSDVKRDDTIFYFTSCGWMMWNWLVSSLALGPTVVLYDGSPFHPGRGALFKIAEEEGITIFGTSAKYITELGRAALKLSERYDLSKLKSILSTGSPLSVSNFEYVYANIKPDLCLSSISGGTDINGCFVLGNPTLPVYAGEIQCKGMGMDVRSFDPNGKSIVGAKGELVCLNPYPSMPLYFWNDKSGEKYFEAYFNVYPDVWRHGDYIEITGTGGAIIYGRSDATLKPRGVRIGTAELYRVVDGIPEIRDSIVVGQNWEDDVRVILFVRLAEGVNLNRPLIRKIKLVIRENLSPRHVPAKIIAVPDIPYTINGKKVELAVKNVIHNQPVTNLSALANPESLKYYKDLEELKS
jgi:acetoacetyl-CoA synthetase